MAQRLWSDLRNRWDPLSSPAGRWTDRDFKLMVFQLRVTSMPDRLWDLDEIKRLPKPTPQATSATHQALQAVWKLQVMTTFHVIWRWRHETPGWPKERVSVYHDACLRAALLQPAWKRTHDSAASCHTAAAIEAIRQRDPERAPLPADAIPRETARYLLFFDGGSRGNPGPGGSGSVIVKTDTTATCASIVWSAAMSAASPTTTNNQAEYDGVITGLRAAKDNGWTPLEVVGDSMLILRQLRDYRPPLNAVLLQKYAEARRLGDALGVRHWRHHLRAHNKMADAAANAAMNASASSQVTHPTARPEHAALEQHLSNDFAHWQTEYLARIG